MDESSFDEPTEASLFDEPAYETLGLLTEDVIEAEPSFDNPLSVAAESLVNVPLAR